MVISSADGIVRRRHEPRRVRREIVTFDNGAKGMKVKRGANSWASCCSAELRPSVWAPW